MDNYKAIIKDKKIQEWLTELKQEAQKRSPAKNDQGLKLEVDRYIYVQGEMKDKKWNIGEGENKKEYLTEVCSFLQQSFFSDIPSNYKIWIVLFDINKIREQYENYKGSTTVTANLPCVASNWIWFECQNYHILQYEKELRVEDQVAEALAPVLQKNKSELSKISVFMFADAMDHNSQPIMKRYDDYRKYLEHCKTMATHSLVLDLQSFLSKFAVNNNA